jgi:hypothetical protein
MHSIGTLPFKSMRESFDYGVKESLSNDEGLKKAPINTTSAKAVPISHMPSLKIPSLKIPSNFIKIKELLKNILPWINTVLNKNLTEIELVESLPKGQIFIDLRNALVEKYNFSEKLKIKLSDKNDNFYIIDKIIVFLDWIKALNLKNIYIFSAFDCFNKKHLIKTLILIDSLKKQLEINFNLQQSETKSKQNELNFVKINCSTK